MKKLNTKLFWVWLPMLAVAGWAAAEPLNYGLADVQASASRPVMQDEMVVRLSISEKGHNRNEVSNKVTRKLNAVLQAARQHSDFKVFVNNRSAYPLVRNEKGRRIDEGWQDTAVVVISSKNLDALNRFAASMQNNAAITGMSYRISDATRKENTRLLTDEAAADFRQRAEQVSRAFGGSSYRIVSVNMAGNAYATEARSLIGFRGAEALSPELAKVWENSVQISAPGEETMTLNINGQIQMMGLH